MTAPGHVLAKAATPWWRDARLRAIGLQVLALLLAGATAWWLAGNAVENLAKRGITVGFAFLERSARFPIAESLLAYRPSDSFAWAFVVGLGNTLFIAVLVSVAATLLGFVLALARRSRNPLVYGFASAFVEAMRNTPLVVQLLFWYALVTVGLPNVHDALNPIAGVFLSDRGLFLPTLQLTGAGLAVEMPRFERFNYVGGFELSPEFTALILGLVLYSAAFVGEIIRGGIGAVATGQWEAARALGLSDRRTLSLVILPQALRIIIPPMGSQYINIIKNTTLALVVGYPDISFVTATAINQSGQAIEGILILMLVFLTISLLASWGLNTLNARLVLAQR